MKATLIHTTEQGEFLFEIPTLNGAKTDFFCRRNGRQFVRLNYCERTKLFICVSVFNETYRIDSDELKRLAKKGDVIVHGKAFTRDQQIRLHSVGRGAYGGEWDKKRGELVSAITYGVSNSSKALTYAMIERLIMGINQNRSYRQAA